MITKINITAYVKFVHKCIENNKYSSVLYYKKIKSKKNKKINIDDEFVNISHFISTLKIFLTNFLKYTQLNNIKLYNILFEIDKCCNHNISLSIGKHQTICMISGKQIKYPSILSVNEKTFYTDRTYDKIFKMFYSMRYIYQMIVVASKHKSENEIVEIIERSLTNLQRNPSEDPSEDPSEGPPTKKHCGTESSGGTHITDTGARTGAEGGAGAGGGGSGITESREKLLTLRVMN